MTIALDIFTNTSRYKERKNQNLIANVELFLNSKTNFNETRAFVVRCKRDFKKPDCYLYNSRYTNNIAFVDHLYFCSLVTVL